MRRDRLTLAMIIGVPLMQLFLFGFAINFESQASADRGLDRRSRRVLRVPSSRRCSNSSYFDDRAGDQLARRGAPHCCRKARCSFVVEIPANFSRDLVRGAQPELLIEADATDPAAGVQRDRARSSELVADGAARRSEGPAGGARAGAAAVQCRRRIRSTIRKPSPNTTSCRDCSRVILTMTMVLMTCLALTRERERGTYENLLAMPATPLEIMIGKIAPNIAGRRDPERASCCWSAKFVFDVPMIGSLLLLSRRAAALHHRQSRGRLHLLDHRPEPASGDADDDVLPAALDPAVGFRLSLPRACRSGRNGSARFCPPRISCASCAASCSRATARARSGPISGRSFSFCSCREASRCSGSAAPWTDLGTESAPC